MIGKVQATRFTGVLERIDNNRVRGRSDDATRLLRLCVDGRWFFCSPVDFENAEGARGALQSIGLSTVVFGAVRLKKGRQMICWLYSHETGQWLLPRAPLKYAGIYAPAVLLCPLIGIGFFSLWPWLMGLPSIFMFLLLPVVIVLMLAAILGGLLAILSLAEMIEALRPSRFLLIEHIGCFARM